MTLARISVFVGLIAIAMTAARPAEAQTQVHDLLKERVGLSDSDIRDLDAGMAMVELPDVGDNREVAVFSIIRVEVPSEFAIDRLRNIEAVLAGGEVAVQMGRFSEEPVAADMTGFELPRNDIRALRECRQGKCDVKLPAEVMRQLQSEVDWMAVDAEAQANRAMANWLIDYLQEYDSRGDAALATYEDKKEPLSVAEGFDILLGESPLILNRRPELVTYLERFPQLNLDGAEDMYYWSVEDFGLKPVTHLYHSTMYRPTGSVLYDAVLARKQIYASHYFQAAVCFVSIAPVPDQEREVGVYVTLFVRQRFDGKVGGIQRATLERGLRNSTRSQLEDVKRRLENSYTAQVGREE